MFFKGDITQNGKITVEDLVVLRLILLEEIPIENLSSDEFWSADVNGDGRLSAMDLSNIRLHLLGKYVLDEVMY